MSSNRSNKYSLPVVLGSVLAALACVSIATPAEAATIAAARSGNWTDGSTWTSGKVPASTDSVAIISGFKVTIPNGKAVTNSGGILVVEGALIVNGTLNSSGELTIPYRSIGSQNNGTLVNKGTMKVDGAKFTNAGTLSNEKSLTVFSGKYMGQLANTSTGVLSNRGTFEVRGQVWNDGKLSNAGQFTLGAAGELSKLEGSGAITNEQAGTFLMAGTLEGNGPFVNAGTVQIANSGSQSQGGFWVRNTFENRGSIRLGFYLRVDTSGALTNTKEGTITAAESTFVNSGRVDNYGKIATGDCRYCDVANLGTLNNHCGATVGRVATKQPITVPCETAATGTSTTPPASPAPPTPPASPTAPTTAFGTSVCSAIRGTTLPSGSELKPGTSFRSPNGMYELAYQTDGNLVVYELPSKKPLWASNTYGVSPLKLVMQTDGNVVARKPDNSVAWSSNTPGSAGAVLSMQDDNNLVVYRKDSCQAVWARR